MLTSETVIIQCIIIPKNTILNVPSTQNHNMGMWQYDYHPFGSFYQRYAVELYMQQSWMTLDFKVTSCFKWLKDPYKKIISVISIILRGPGL
jgi:hypothetical protein